jgi:CO dehydrogenase maturation factor
MATGNGKVIAVTGKGGCGKTTVASLLIRLMVERSLGPVLAVDADPNLNLNAALGVPVEATVGDVREDTLARIEGLPGGMSKTEYLRFRTAEALVEAKGFDLIAMGRPEGPGCYCYANSILRACVDELVGRYPWVVMDTEAGLEHISRRTTRDVDVMLILSDPTVRGLETAFRIVELAWSLKTRVGEFRLAINRVQGEIPTNLVSLAAERGFPNLAAIAEDASVRALDAQGSPLVQVPPDSPALLAVTGLLDSIATPVPPSPAA